MKCMNLTSLQQYRPSTTKFVYMCALKKIPSNWEFMILYKKTFHQIHHFVIPMVFNVAIYATYIFLQSWITFEYLHDLSMPPFEQEKTNEKITKSKKLEKLKIKHEEKKIVIK